MKYLYEYIYIFSNRNSDQNSVANIKPLSRSFFKMIEMTHEFFPEIILNKHKFRTDHRFYPFTKTIDEKNYVGFIAQDYEQVFPEQIKLTEPVGKEAELVDDKVKNISSNLNPYFVLAIQEQHAKITSLEAQLASLKATVDALVASTGHLVV